MGRLIWTNKKMSPLIIQICAQGNAFKQRKESGLGGLYVFIYFTALPAELDDERREDGIWATFQAA